MYPITSYDGPRKDARSSESAEPGLLRFRDPIEEHAADGGEYLDDALRMHEQTLGGSESEDEE
jgi:hypothetical protein